MRNKWTYEKCKVEALKYNTKKELAENSIGVMRAIWYNKWYELCGHMKLIGNLYKRLIYVYEFSDNSCYVGLTCDVDRRNYQHIYTDNSSSVYKHIQETGLKPTLIIKTDYLDVKEAAELESKIEQEYENKGWNILNKIKTGGIGGGYIKWTYEECSREALKYTKLCDFYKKSRVAYDTCKENGWYEITKHLIESDFKGENNSFYGKKHTTETKLKMSENKKLTQVGENNSFYGKKHTTETKNIIAEKQRSNNIGNKNPFYGKKHSKETIEKLKLVKRDNKHSCKKVYQIDKSGNIVKIWDNIVDAAEQILGDRKSSLITAACKGRIKTAGGYYWKYLD